MTIMGFVDCLIFSIREKPWQSISTSDGTLWGSFAVFHGKGRVRHASAAGSERETTATTMSGVPLETKSVRTSMQQSMVGGITRIRSGVRMSSSSNERMQVALSEARARLELEKEDRLAAARARIFSYTCDDDEDDGWEGGVDNDGLGRRDTIATADLEKGKGRAEDGEV